MKASERLPEWERKFRELVGDAFDDVQIRTGDFNNVIQATVAIGKPDDGLRYVRWGIGEDPDAVDIAASMPPERAAKFALAWREGMRIRMAEAEPGFDPANFPNRILRGEDGQMFIDQSPMTAAERRRSAPTIKLLSARFSEILDEEEAKLFEAESPRTITPQAPDPKGSE